MLLYIVYFWKMEMVNKFLFFYIKSSIHVALAVTALSLINYHLLSLKPNNNILYFIFFSSLFSYNFIKYYLLPKTYLRWTTLFNKILLFLNTIALVSSILYMVRFSRTSFLWIGFLTLLNILYSIPVGKKNWRSYGLLKPFIVIFVWAGISIVLPVIEANGTLDLQLLIFVVQQAVFVLILLLLFEIRDLQYDPQVLRTIPMRLHLKKTKHLSYGLALFWISLFWIQPSIEFPYSSIFIFFCLIGAIQYSKPERPYLFTAFWVEAIPIIWLLLYYVFDISF